jgi:hypothetical protein
MKNRSKFLVEVLPFVISNGYPGDQLPVAQHKNAKEFQIIPNKFPKKHYFWGLHSLKSITFGN